MRNLIKLFAVTLLGGMIIFPIYAFAFSNSEAEESGEGAGTISGWTTSNVHYQLSSDSALVQNVSFDLDAPASRVSVKLRSASTTYTSCLNVNAYHWQCDFPTGISLASLDELRVIAVGN